MLDSGTKRKAFNNGGYVLKANNKQMRRGLIYVRKYFQPSVDECLLIDDNG